VALRHSARAASADIEAWRLPTRNPVGVSQVVADRAYQPFRSVSENPETRHAYCPAVMWGRTAMTRLGETDSRNAAVAEVCSLASWTDVCPRQGRRSDRKFLARRVVRAVNWAFMVSTL
jgi:hypothetical protein